MVSAAPGGPHLGQRLLAASVGGVALSHAYLTHWGFAWLGVLGLGVALAGAAPAEGGARQRRLAPLVGAVFNGWVGLHCWGFIKYGAAVFGATVAYSVLAGALFGWLLQCAPAGPRRALWAAAAWAAVEWLRQLGAFGFPLFIGGTQADGPVGAALSVVGAVGVSALMVALGVALGEVLAASTGARLRAAARASRGPVLGAAALLLACTLLGRWQPGLRSDGAPRQVAVVQGALPNFLYAVSNVSMAAKALVESRYFERTRTALESGASLVFLPEDVLNRPVSVDDGEIDEALFEPLPGAPTAPEAVGVFVVAGAKREDYVVTEVDEYLATYNSALLLPGGDAVRVLDFVDKYMIVPIAEAHLSRGRTDPFLDTGALRIGVLICYESMYPRMGRRAAEGGLLVVLTNDAGFYYAPVARTHAIQAITRARETGRPLARAAQSGISYVIDESGAVVAHAGLFEDRVLTGTVQPTQGWTWFRLAGYWLGPLLAAASLARRLTSLRRSRRVQASSAASSTA